MNGRNDAAALTEEFIADLSRIADKHRLILGPLADREDSLADELREVRAKRIAVESCLRPLERVIAEQRTVVSTAEGDVSGAIAAAMYASKVGNGLTGIGG